MNPEILKNKKPYVPETETELHDQRDSVVDEFYDRKRQPPFMFCRRTHDPGTKERLEYDREGECAMCSVSILYDARFDKVSHRICLPCAVKCAEEGMTELSNLKGWEPDQSGATDEEMHARLVANYNENLGGAVRL